MPWRSSVALSTGRRIVPNVAMTIKTNWMPCATIRSHPASSGSAFFTAKMKKGPKPLFSRAKVGSGRERRPAAAGALRVGVLDHELRAFQALLVVDLGAREVLVAHRVDEQRDAILLHRGVVLVLDLVEREAVLEARTAAPGDEHAELELRVAFLVDQLLDLVGCAVAEDQRGRHLCDCVHLAILSLPTGGELQLDPLHLRGVMHQAALYDRALMD